MLPRSALIIIDVQNDFIDGSLGLINCPAKQDGAEVVPVINEMLDTIPFDAVAYTLDWHPNDHCSFIDNVNMRKISDKSPVKLSFENLIFLLIFYFDGNFLCIKIKVTKDFQLYDTIIFDAFPEAEQKLWPKHCVQDTKGSELHPDLNVIDQEKDEMKRAVIFTKKGCNSDIDSYSAFFDNCKLNETNLDQNLKALQITDIYVCGLAADVCVGMLLY